MSEMVERVAQALVAANHEANSIILPWDRQKEPAREIARVQARAAIAAMREPTEAMWDHEEARSIWRAMIDAALSDA